jgi:glycosyltransferase involved in cell wall biosynthesis
LISKFEEEFEMKLSIIMPVYNEKNTIRKIIEKVIKVKLEKEIIIVDDNSSDGTREILKNEYEDKEDIKIIYKNKNEGKTDAIKDGIKYVKGDIVIIQDADLEYEPEDYLKLVKPIVENEADVVYGSRFLNKKYKFSLWLFANKFLTYLTNLFTGLKLTDMETCYKTFRSEIIKNLKIESKKFCFEPEITVKIAKRKYRIKEVPISYSPRNFREGKKINWKDGFSSIFTIIKYSLKD